VALVRDEPGMTTSIPGTPVATVTDTGFPDAVRPHSSASIYLMAMTSFGSSFAEIVKTALQDEHFDDRWAEIQRAAGNPGLTSMIAIAQLLRQHHDLMRQVETYKRATEILDQPQQSEEIELSAEEIAEEESSRQRIQAAVEEEIATLPQSTRNLLEVITPSVLLWFPSFVLSASDFLYYFNLTLSFLGNDSEVT
jgi:hypothetical protein